MVLDYSLTTAEERIAFLNKNLPELDYSKELLADYILDTYNLHERKEKGILNKNRIATIKKRECYIEEVKATDQMGEPLSAEESLYHLQREGKGYRLSKKMPSEVPDDLKPLENNIKEMQKRFDETPEGEPIRFLLKKVIIEMYRELRNAQFDKLVPTINTQRSPISGIPIDEKIYIDEEGNPQSTACISLLNPEHVAHLLDYYCEIKQEVDGEYNDDFYYLLLDFEDIVAEALPEELYQILELKIDGATNKEVQKQMLEKYGKHYAETYISTVWKNTIPEKIANEAQKRALLYYYTEVEYGQWKRCSNCREIKLAHPLFFSKNAATKDGYYSICKDCRNLKYLESKKSKKK